MARMGYPFDGFLFFSPIVLCFRLHTLLVEQRQLCLERHILAFLALGGLFDNFSASKQTSARAELEDAGPNELNGTY
jgi:hypothetical protein